MSARAKAKPKAKTKAAPKAKTKAEAEPKRPTKGAAKEPVVPAAPVPVVELHVGEAAPDFSLADDRGEIVTLKGLRGKRVVLYFYPKDDTPGCTQESCDFRDRTAEFARKNAVIYGVSRDSVPSHARFKAKHGLNFPLLSDESGKALQAYGVWKEKSMYGRKYMGIERSTFVIDVDGKISMIYPKVSVTGHVDAVLKALS